MGEFFWRCHSLLFVWVITKNLTVEQIPLILEVARSTLISPVWVTNTLSKPGLVVYESGLHFQLLLLLLQLLLRKMRKTNLLHLFSLLVVSIFMIQKYFFFKTVLLSTNLITYVISLGWVSLENFERNSPFIPVLIGAYRWVDWIENSHRQYILSPEKFSEEMLIFNKTLPPMTDETKQTYDSTQVYIYLSKKVWINVDDWAMHSTTMLFTTTPSNTHIFEFFLVTITFIESFCSLIVLF